MRRPEPRRRWVAARWALRGVLERYLGEDPEKVELEAESHGKPVLRRAAGPLRFNLSHSRDLALIAVSHGVEVGVDVEWVDPCRDVLALAPRALGSAEAEDVVEAHPEDRPAIFYAAWTRREAIAKCFGVGLGAPLPELDVAVSAVDAGPGFAAAVAVAGREALPLRSFAIEPDLSPSTAG
jgi:4'-phosphopantetheinyl transferase